MSIQISKSLRRSLNIKYDIINWFYYWQVDSYLKWKINVWKNDRRGLAYSFNNFKLWSLIKIVNR